MLKFGLKLMLETVQLKYCEHSGALLNYIEVQITNIPLP